MSFFEALSRDARLLDGLLRTLFAYRNLKVDGVLTVADDLESSIDRHRDRIAFRFENENLTYAAFDARANRFAHWAQAQGLKRGDCVALFLSNCPDYVACWFGLSKIGVTTALINTNLAGAALAHCINVAQARHVVSCADLAPALAGAQSFLTEKAVSWCVDAAAGTEDLAAALAQVSDARPDRALRRDMRTMDPALYVFTSGTTGAPKAARMTHLRVMGMMRAFIGGGHARHTDRVYLTLPLYHATGGLTAIGFALEKGGAVILRGRFSASHFWRDCCDEGATVFFYIGELCRYLLNAPEQPAERAHTLRLGVGNGLRPEIWERFQARFKIPQMLEFYGSTEGNANLLNFDGKMGSIGRIPSWLRAAANIRVVKYDVETDTIVRGLDGLCVEAAPDEPGEAIGEIRQSEPRYKFEGYTGDPAQTEKKILRNVFRKDDSWFRTGDLMRKDKDGYFYFVDRIGDTFRWKGENVSTNEVADSLTQTPGVEEAVVYGVKLGALDGRAGMAAITPGEGFDFATLHARVTRDLPPFARPLFLRIQRAIETTGTFKYRKIDLVRDGADPAIVSDPLYWDDEEAGVYAPLTPDIYAEIVSGARRI